MLQKAQAFLTSFKYKTAVRFTVSSLMMGGGRALTGLIVISWVLPEDIGLWSSLLVIPAYAVLLQVGVISGFNRELPFFLGKDDQQEAYYLAATAKWLIIACVLLTLVATAGTLGVLAWFPDITTKLWIGVLGIGIYLASKFYQSYLQVTFRANRSFDDLARINFWMSGLILVSVLLPFYFGFYGLVIRTVFNNVVMTIVTHRVRPIRVKAKFSKPGFIKLLKTGVPLFSLGYFQEITATFDRVILLQIGGVIAVGLYAPALAVLSGMFMLAGSVGQYVYPQMSYHLGRTNDPSMLWRWVWKPSLGIIGLSLPVILVSWWLMPWAISSFFPKYIDGIFAARLAVVSGMFSAAVVGVNVLNSLKAWKWLLGLTLFKLGLFYGAIQVFAHVLDPLDGVAVGLLVSDAVYYIVAMIVCYYVTQNTDMPERNKS